MAKEERGQGYRQDLLDSLRKADARAWAEVIARYKDKVFSFTVRMLRNREEAEDVCQEVWERAVRSIGSFRGDASFDTWLCTIALNRCLTRLDAAERVQGVDDEA